jgi:molybdopterin-containing oxidoreductase family membrane subunit
MIVVLSLNRDFLPSAWKQYVPTVWDWLTLLGTIGFFVFFFALFLLFVPASAMAVARELPLKERQGHGGEGVHDVEG